MRRLTLLGPALLFLLASTQACDPTADTPVIGVGLAPDGRLTVYLVACSRFDEILLNLELRDTTQDTSLWSYSFPEVDSKRTQAVVVPSVTLPKGHTLIARANEQRALKQFPVKVEFVADKLRNGDVYYGTGDYVTEVAFFATAERDSCKH